MLVDLSWLIPYQPPPSWSCWSRPGQSASLVRNVRTVRVDGGGCEWLMRVGLEKHKHDHAGHGDIQPDRKRDACEAAVLSEPLAEAQE
jgi:hypothetical protein